MPCEMYPPATSASDAPGSNSRIKDQEKIASRLAYRSGAGRCPRVGGGVRSDYEAVVSGSEVLGALPGVLALVIARVVETDRKGKDPLVRSGGVLHCGGDDRAVHPA